MTLVASFAFFITACHKSNNSSAPTADKIGISAMGYSPASLTVTPGSTVTWTNMDSAVHTVTTADGVLNSGDIKPAATFTFTFSTAGAFNYYDDHNRSMKGVITVSKASGSGY